MLAPLLVAIAILAISCILFFRGPVRISGIGFFSITRLEYKKRNPGTKYFERILDWSIGDATEYSKEWDRLLRAVAFALRVTGFKIRLDMRRIKFILSLDTVQVLISPLTSETIAQEKPTGNMPIWLIRILRVLIGTTLAVTKALFTFRVGRINLLFTQFPNSIPNESIQYWNCLQVTIQKISLFDGEKLLTVGEVTGSEVHFDEAAGAIIERKSIVQLNPMEIISVQTSNVPHSATHHSLSTSKLCIDVWPTTMLLITSAVYNLKGMTRNSPARDQDSLDIHALLNAIVPARTILSLAIQDATLHAHYPISNPDSRRFESLKVSIQDFQVSACLDPKEALPHVISTASSGRMIAVAAGEIGENMIPKVSTFFGVSFEGLQEDLLVLKEIVISNCWFPNEYQEHLDETLIARWTDKVTEGKPVWSVSSACDPEFDKVMSTVKPPARSFYSAATQQRQPFSYQKFQMIPKTIMVQTSQICFDVPYEFPLSNCFDHLSYFIKIAQSPFQKKSDRQDFYPFAHTWRLRVMSRQCRFTIADDAFERRLQRCLYMKKLLHSKLSRMDRIFWDHCKEETDKVSSKNTEDRWVASSLRVLAGASEHPEVLKANPYLVSCYVRLQEKLFGMYKEYFKSQKDPDPDLPLFKVGAKNVDLNLQWKEHLVSDMSLLLNSIDGDNTLTMEEVSEFGLFLGGFTDLSAHELSVSLRDYSVPLCSASGARILGLLFLIEEPSYLKAKSKLLIPVSGAEGQWNHCGSDDKSRVCIHKSILPVKIYHSLQLSIVGGEEGEPAVSGFSPLYEGAFQMLDRAFELFSKPSEEPSPFLPFWDKLRLLMRGVSSSVLVRTECHFIALLGKDIYTRDECISLAFPEGFELGLDGSQILLKVPRAVAFMNSESEAILKWLYQTSGQAFYAKDASLLDSSLSGGGQIPIVSFPKVEFAVLFEMFGIDGQRPISHTNVRIRAGKAHDDGERGAYDSYRSFRINKLNLSITITADDSVDEARRLLVFYYRELEDWFVKGFGRFVTPPVKPGSLFKFSTLSKKATPKLAAVLNDVKFRLNFNGIFMVRGLQFYDDKNFGGMLLRSEGRTKLIFVWRKGTRSANNPSSGQWFNHFAEINFATTQIGMLVPKSSKRLASPVCEGLSNEYDDVAFFTVLSAPLLFYLKVNQSCFKADSESQAIQARLISSRLEELNQEIDTVAQELRQCDPNADMQGFTTTRRKLSVLLEQQSLIARFAPPERGGEEVDPGSLISYYQIIIQYARLFWHQSVRNAVFALVDQQFQFFRVTQAFGRLVESMASEKEYRPATTPLGSPPPSASESDAFMESLIMRDSPFEVGPEMDSCNDNLSEQREEMMLDPEELRERGVSVSLRIDFDLIAPQIILIDTENDTEEAAIVITAQAASLKYGTINLDEQGPIVGRRSKIVLEQAVMFAAFKSDFGEKGWPPVYPIEYLLSQETETTRFYRISEKVKATFVYDVANSRFQGKRGLHSPLRSIFGQGDTLRVDLNGLVLMTTSAEYSVLYDVIVNLMVYRDETQKVRSEQLESIILATNLLQQSDLVTTVRRMQNDVALHLCAVTGKLQRAINRDDIHAPRLSEDFTAMKASLDDIALIVDALQTASANREKLKQKQTRLLLDVVIGKIQWTLRKATKETLCEMALLGIHDAWLSAPDGTQSNLMEIGALRAKNCLPNAFYQTLFCPLPEEVRNAMYNDSSGFRGIGTQGNSIRFYFKAQPPVSGIKIVEHVELNLAPQQVQLTRDIAEEFINFFFPERAKTSTKDVTTKGAAKPDALTAAEPAGGSKRATILGGLKSGIKNTASSFISRFNEQMDDEDIALMATRSAENCSFVYINVPASQHLISYKGPGDKSITDVENFILKLPDFEYHSHLWSWFEFTLQLKRDMIRVVLSNVSALLKDKIKRLGQANVPESEGEPSRRVLQKLSANAKVREDPDSKEAQERKAKMLLGKSYRK